MNISSSTILHFRHIQRISFKCSHEIIQKATTKQVRLVSSSSITLLKSREIDNVSLAHEIKELNPEMKDMISRSPNRRKRLTNTLNKILDSASKITTDSYIDKEVDLASNRKKRKGLYEYDHIFKDITESKSNASPGIDLKSNVKESLSKTSIESNSISWTWAKPIHVQKKEIEKRKSEIENSQSNQEKEVNSSTLSFSSSYKIPIETGVFLKEDEITQALHTLGGLDINVVPLEKDLNMGEAMIFCSGRSGPHLRRLADALVKALRSRDLKQTVGYGGAEGYECDDWMIVDCETYIVQLMHPEKRAQLKLEEHWAKGNSRPFIPVTTTLNEWEREIDKLLTENPLPEGYDISVLASRAKDSDKLLQKYFKQK